MHIVIDKVGEALLTAAGMAWQTGWTLVLGFAISALLQSVVSTDEMKRALGRGGPKEIALASLAGAASSSCSYASAAIMRTLFKKGAALVTALAYLYADLIVLPLLDTYRRYFGWRMAAYIGGVSLRDDGDRLAGDKPVVHGPGPRAGPGHGRAGEPDPLQPELHVLAQPPVRCAGRLPVVGQPEASDAPSPRRTGDGGDRQHDHRGHAAEDERREHHRAGSASSTGLRA